jgi:hypothetical protein
MPLAGGEEAVIADLLKALGQDVLQETADELLSREGARLPATGSPVTVTEGDLTVLTFENPVVGKSNAKDIGGQVFEGGLTCADRLAVDDPLLPPDLKWDLVEQVGLLQSGAELGPKQPGEGFDVNQESVAGTPPGVPISGQTAAGNEVMNVGMVGQIAGPGL